MKMHLKTQPSSDEIFPGYQPRQVSVPNRRFGSHLGHHHHHHYIISVIRDLDDDDRDGFSKCRFHTDI
jgi:hypothetical protein